MSPLPPERPPEPVVDAPTPVTHNRLFRSAALALLHLAGWKVAGQLPAEPRYVLVGAPHTSNWDFPLMLMAAAYFGIKPYWMGKKGLFPRPVAGLMRWLGGIPIDRSAAHNMVDQVVAAFDRQARLVLVIAPEGTRSRVPRWKSGFYHIATGAGVPIVLAYADYRHRVVGIGPTIHPGGDMQKDLLAIQGFYADKSGRHPQNAGPVLPLEEPLEKS